MNILLSLLRKEMNNSGMGWYFTVSITESVQCVQWGKYMLSVRQLDCRVTVKGTRIDLEDNIFRLI